MQNLNIAVNDRVWPDFHVGRMSNWGMVYAIETSSPRLVWTKYESYILHTSAAIYTFQNLNTGINDKVWPDLDLGEGQTEEGVCTTERSYPKLGVGQTLKQHLEYFSSNEHFSKLKRKTPIWV